MKRQELIKSLPVKQITVLLAEDHSSVRKSLKLSLELDGDIEVVGEAKNGREAVRLTMSLHPEVIVMDIGMPLLNGLQATRQIMANSPATRVLILSAHPDPEYIRQAVMLGASGYLIKQSSTQVLAQAVREVLKGNSFFCAPISKPLRAECKKLFGKGELLKKRAARLAFPDSPFNN
ncbi:MAG TPA: response regulator transcription factor [Candidatus Methylacidiphilales bacterium]|jgi:DNA-binding NarL/FixJ family response regulator|nr:response regulator transcription factor [Candidatus Methylacidiphilales bacterium]